MTQPVPPAVLLIALLLVCVGPTAAVNLGNIPARPVAPELPLAHFFETRRLTQLEIAPDNRTLYALRNDGRVRNVFAIDLASAEMRQLTRFDEPVRRFFVDPGNRFLIIVQDERGDETHDLYRFDLASGAVNRLTRTPGGDTCTVCGLSPDGEALYFTRTHDGRRAADVWRVATASGRLSRQLAGRGRLLECEDISPDGRHLLLGEHVGISERHLGLLDLGTGRARAIMQAPGSNNVDAGFAPDGAYFLSAWHSDRIRLWHYRHGDRAPAPVALPFDNDIDSLSLHSDGRVAVIGYRQALTGGTAIFIDGFDEMQTYGFAADDIQDAVFSRDDPALGIVTVENATTPPRYYLVGRQDPVLLYDANRSGIDNRFFADVRSLAVPGFDGLGIPVHLFIPNGTSADRPRPVILMIHGGPEQHIDPVYMARIQFLANRGFIVVTPNVRGSTGFGRRYAELALGDWGGAHIRDSVAVAGFVRSLDFVDGENLFVAGSSFGGFSVMSLITQYPVTFRAAVNFFGITDFATFTDNLPSYQQRSLPGDLGFDPRTDPVRNRELSPLYHIDRIRIPLQVHQGANDRRVPRSQSDRLVQRLRELGREVEYHVYPDEGHGFSRFANERAAFDRMLAFFRRNMRRTQSAGAGDGTH